MFTQSLSVDLRKASAAIPDEAQNVIDLVLDRDRQLLMDGDLITSADMQYQLQALIAVEAGLVVRLSADTVIPYGQVAEIMGVVRQSGVQRLAFAVGPPIEAD